MTGKIAIVDDYEGARDLLESLLAQHNSYSVSSYPAAGKFLDSFSRRPPPDLVVLDLQLPGISGWDCLKILKENPETRRILVFLVSGHYTQTSDIVRGLEMGADEYICKPFDAEIFLARLDALMRRASWQAGTAPVEKVQAGPLILNLSEHAASLDNEVLVLTPLEYELLRYMVRNSNRVLTRGLILEQVWKGDPTMTTRTVDKHIENLRKKLREFGKRIETVIGVGYVLKM